MGRTKTLQELTIKDNFMFSAVMSNEDNCRYLLELILDFKIEKVEVSLERNIVYHSEYKGVRLDVYAKDSDNTRYNVEMQSVTKDNLPKRSRYYHSQIDVELLLKGTGYSELPDTYVIFICDFDPFGKGKYCYSFEKQCVGDTNFPMSDGSKTIFLSTMGRNEHEVSESLVKFMKYVKADLAESTLDYEDSYVRRLQRTVHKIKQSREMEARYMTLQELLKDERKAGLADAIIVLLNERGIIPKEMRTTIENEYNQETLNNWLKLAANSKSIEEFQNNMLNL